MNDSSSTDDAAWAEIGPLIDAELNRLPATDRAAVVLRFFENRTLRDVGTALGTSEEGARKRVTRALDKLRTRFVRRGIAAPGAAGLAVLVSEHITMSADAGMITVAAQAGLATPLATGSSFATGPLAAILWKSAAVAAVAALGFAGGRAATLPVRSALSEAVATPGTPPLTAGKVSPAAPRPPQPSHLIARLTAEDAMLARIARASATELAALFDEYHSDLTPALFALLCQRWASLDSAGALNHLRHKHDTDIGAFYKAWGGADFQKALTTARQEAGWWKNDCVQETLASLLPQGVEKFFAIAAGEKASCVSAKSVEVAMRTLAADGLDKALAVFATLKEPHLSTPAARVLASLKATANPDEALAWAKSLPEGPGREAALQGALLTIADRDPERAIPLLSLTRGEDKEGWNDIHVARSLVSRDARTGLAWAAANLPVNTLERYPYLLEQASGLSLVERLQLMRSVRHRMVDEKALTGSLRAFDRASNYQSLCSEVTDCIADIRTLAAEPADGTRNAMLGQLASQMQQTDPAGLLKALPSFPPDIQRMAAARILSSPSKDPASLTSLFPLLEQGGDVSTTLQTFGGNLVEKGAATVESILSGIPPVQRPDVAQGAAAAWAANDPESAIAWVASLPEPERIAATGSVATQLARNDEMSASKWIAAMPRGAVRDAAARGLSVPLARSEPDSAWQWALSIDDSAMRTETLGSVYQEWAKKGKAAAAAALAASPLSAAEQRTVESAKPTRPQ